MTHYWPELLHKIFRSYKVAFFASASSFLPLTAFELTGGYYNPNLATGLKLGCLGEDDSTHFLVGVQPVHLYTNYKIKKIDHSNIRPVRLLPFLSVPVPICSIPSVPFPGMMFPSDPVLLLL